MQPLIDQIIGWAAAAAFVGVALWKGWPIFRNVVERLAALVKLADTLATLPADLDFIKHELQANSGKSVKDIATRTELAVDSLVGEVAHVRRQNAALKTSISKTNRRLTEHIEQQRTEIPT